MKIADIAAINTFNSNTSSYYLSVEKDKTGEEHLVAKERSWFGRAMYKLGIISSTLPKVENYFFRQYGKDGDVSVLDRTGCESGCSILADKIERYHQHRPSNGEYQNRYNISHLCHCLRQDTISASSPIIESQPLEANDPGTKQVSPPADIKEAVSLLMSTLDTDPTRGIYYVADILKIDFDDAGREKWLQRIEQDINQKSSEPGQGTDIVEMIRGAM